MKIYAKYPEGITKIIKEKEFYQTEDLSNTITVYVDRTNLTDITYTLTLEFLRADGRKTSLVAAPFVAGEETTLEEDDITYDIHNFVLTETQLAVAGALAFTCYITIFNNDVMISRGVLFNAINNVRKTVAYSTNTILVIDNDGEDVPVIVADMKNAIDILNGQLAGVTNAVKSIQALENLSNIVGSYSELEALITIGEATEYKLHSKVQVLNDSTHDSNSTLYDLEQLDIEDGLVQNYNWNFVGYYDGYNKEQIDDIISDFESDVNDRLNQQNETIAGLGQLQPSGVDTSTNILNKESNTGIWIGSDTGHWYYWNGTQYADGGIYQASQLPYIDGFVVYSKRAYIDFTNKQLIFPSGGGILFVVTKKGNFYLNNSQPINSNYIIDFSSYTYNAGVIVYNTTLNTISIKQSYLMTDNDVLLGAFALSQHEFYLSGNYVNDNILNVDGYCLSEKPIIFDFINKKIKYEGGSTQVTIMYGENQREFYNNSYSTTAFEVDITTQLQLGNLLSINYNLDDHVFVLKTITNRTNRDVYLGLMLVSQEQIIFNGNFRKYKCNYENMDDINQDYIYPKYPIWGSEYLYSWYQKLKNGDNVKIVCSGDSTTEKGSQGFTRDALLKKILIKGGYDSTKITSINRGHSEMWTGQWINGVLYPPTNEATIPEYGYLNQDMSDNPDLYVLGWGYNDGSPAHIPNVDMNERARQFEERYREGLNRIRTNGTYTTGPSYNKTMIDLPIIICTPISTYSSSGVNNLVWQNKIRGIIQRLCREYQCAFVDISTLQYDHKSYTEWSLWGDRIHPNDLCNTILFSYFKDLIYPLLLEE